MTDPKDLDILLREIDALIEEQRGLLVDRAVRFVGMAEDADGRRERILNMATVMMLDGRDPVLDNIISSFSPYEEDGNILDDAWAIGDTIGELETLKARLKSPVRQSGGSMRKAGHISVRRPVRDIRGREVYFRGREIYDVVVPLKDDGKPLEPTADA